MSVTFRSNWENVLCSRLSNRVMLLDILSTSSVPLRIPLEAKSFSRAWVRFCDNLEIFSKTSLRVTNPAKEQIRNATKKMGTY